MSTRVFHRPVRRSGPAAPTGEIMLDACPEQPESSTSGGMGQVLTYLPMLAGAGATGLLVSGSGGQPITYLASGMMALSMVGMAVNGAGRGAGERRRRIESRRRDYHRHLDRARRRVRTVAGQQRAAALWRHPDPHALWCVPAGTRLWERRPGDEDFLAVRVGCGCQPLALAIEAAPDRSGDVEPVSGAARARFLRTHATVAAVPVTLELMGLRRLNVEGVAASRRDLARAMIAQLVAFHPPDDLVIAACTAGAGGPEWEWLKWLPHTLSRTATDALGPVRLGGSDLTEVEALVVESLGGDGSGDAGGGSRSAAQHADRSAAGARAPHVVVVLDGGRPTRPASGAEPPRRPELSRLHDLGATTTVLDLGADFDLGGWDDVGVSGADGAAHTASVRVVTDPGTEPGLLIGRPGPAGADASLGVADGLSIVEAESLARRLSPLRLPVDGAGGALGARRSLTDLLGLGDPHVLDPDRGWSPRSDRDRLRVPIGVDAHGSAVELDLKESAQGGAGPHGLVIGATGSGKSELLRTLVCGLAVTHSPQALNFVLIDFKGGATFASLDALPHTSAVITNLADELVLVDRMQDAVRGELVRRQEVLRAAGNYASVRDYERAREDGAALEPLPSLLVVVDEFSELLSAKPDFIDLFVMIGRLGRSLGVHLLLASQRLDEGKLRGLDTHLSFRIALRTFSAAESRVVLGVPDAYELPNSPGHGYLADGAAGRTRFTAAYVSGAPTPPTASTPLAMSPTASTAMNRGGRAQVRPYEMAYVAPDAGTRAPTGEQRHDPVTTETTRSLLDVVVARLADAGPPARRIWLAPLSSPPSLGELLPAAARSGRGEPGAPPSFAAPIGVLDRPAQQRRDLHRIELASAHFVVVGRPQSGKSTVLRTLVAGLAVTHTPAQVQFYCLDFGGGTLLALSDLPHVGSVATRSEPERLRRTIGELEALLASREQLFTTHRVDSMATYRHATAAGSVPHDGYGEVFLVVDGWEAVRADHEQLADAIMRLAARGLGYGVHVLLSAQRWADLRPAFRDLIGARLELRLGDPSESEIDRRTAAAVPPGSPGRGLSPNGLHFLAALPRVDDHQTVADLADGVADLVAGVRRTWGGPDAPPVRLLPADLPADELPPLAASGAQLPFGLYEDTMSAVSVDFDAEPHLLVVGDTETGKSNLLRVLAAAITARWTPAEAKVITIDYRRGLVGAVPRSHLIASALHSQSTPAIAGDIVAALHERLANVQVNPASGEPATWTGPRLFVLVDDYDLVATSQGNPLRELQEFLPHARDIGLHLVLSRAAGGAGQGMFEPLIRSLRDAGTPGVLLSGNRDEGVILGTVRLESLPPGRGRLVHRRSGTGLIQTARAAPVTSGVAP